MAGLPNPRMANQFARIKKRHKEEMAAFHAKWKVTGQTVYRKMDGQRKGAGKEDIKDSLIAEQENFCVICVQEFSYKKEAHLDHCHETGQVREVLCHNCNVGIGHFKDDVELLQKAIEYINKHKELFKKGQYQIYR